MQSKTIAIGVLCLQVLFIASCDNRPDMAQSILDAFGTGCTVNGRWTERALSHNRKLIQITEEMENTDPCKPYQQTLRDINSYSRQIQDVLSNSYYSDYRVAEETLQELTLELGQSSDADMQAFLKTEIVTQTADLARRRAENSVYEDIDRRDGYWKSTERLAKSIEGMLNNTNQGLTACLKKSPGYAAQMATDLLGIGGSFISPVFGAATSVIAGLFKIVIEAIENSTTQEARFKLQSAQLPVAMSCALESMSELYCDAEDSHELLEVQRKGYPDLGKLPDPLWRGMDLLGRRFPILGNWLLKLKAGADPQNTDDGGRMTRILEKYNSLTTIRIGFRGAINEKLPTINALPPNDPNIKGIIAGVAVSIIDILIGYDPSTHQSKPTAYTDLSTDGYKLACWLFLGPNPAGGCPANNVGEAVKSFITRQLAQQISIINLETNFDRLEADARRITEAELSQNMSPDPEQILASAFSEDFNQIRPRDIVRLISEYLVNLKNTDLGEIKKNNPRIEGLLNELLAVIDDAGKILDGVYVPPGGGTLTPAQQVYEIFNKLQLRWGLLWVNERLITIVREDIQLRMRRGEYPKEAEDILRAAGTDLARRMMASGLSKETGNVLRDLNSAQGITTNNLVVFRELFSTLLGRTVRELNDNARKYDNPENPKRRKFGQDLGRMCALIYVTGLDWPSSVSWDVCMKSFEMSWYEDEKKPGADLTLRFEKLQEVLKNAPLEKRMCAYHRFKRHERLADALIDRLGQKGDGNIKSVNFIAVPGGNWLPHAWSSTWMMDAIRGGAY